MPLDKREVALHALLAEPRDEPLAHAVDPLAHLGQLAFPLAAEHRIAEDFADHGRAVGRGIGVTGARGDFEVAQGPFRSIGVRTDQSQGTDTLIVQTEIFGKGTGHQQLAACVADCPQAPSRLRPTHRRTPDRQIDQGQQAALDDDLGDLPPKVRSGVAAGGIVATAVQQHYVASGNLPERCEQGVGVEAVGTGVEIGIGLNL